MHHHNTIILFSLEFQSSDDFLTFTFIPKRQQVFEHSYVQSQHLHELFPHVVVDQDSAIECWIYTPFFGVSHVLNVVFSVRHSN